MGEGRCRLFPYLSIERKKYTFFLPYVKYVFDFHRPAPPSFRALSPTGRGLKKVPVGAGRLQTFYREKFFYFFSLCVKTVFDRLTPAHLPPTGRGLKKGAGRRRSFTNLSIEKKNMLFLLRMLRLYLTGLHRHTCRPTGAWMESKD